MAWDKKKIEMSKALNAPAPAAKTASSIVLENSSTYTTVGNPIGLVATNVTIASSGSAARPFNTVQFVQNVEIVTDAVGVRAASTVGNVTIRQTRNGASSQFINTPVALNVGCMEAMAMNYRRKGELIPPLLSDELGLLTEQIDDTAAGLKTYRVNYPLPLVGLPGDQISITSTTTGAAGAGTTPTAARGVWEVVFNYSENSTCGPKEFTQLIRTDTAAVLAAATVTGTPSRAVTQLPQPMYSNPRCFAFGISAQSGNGIAATFAESIVGVNWNPGGELGPLKGDVPRECIDSYRFNHGGASPVIGFTGMAFRPRPHVIGETMTILNGPVVTGVVASIVVAYLCEA